MDHNREYIEKLVTITKLLEETQKQVDALFQQLLTDDKPNS